MRHSHLPLLLFALTACGRLHGPITNTMVGTASNTNDVAGGGSAGGSTGGTVPVVSVMPVSPASPVCKGQPIWNDEFSGTGLNLNKWNIEVNCSGGGNNEQQCYVSNSNNLLIDGQGHLVITVLKETGYALPYTSARINSATKGDWDFGCFEARLQVPPGQGLWPAFWMLSTNNPYGTWPSSGELDIMEILGQDTTKLYGTAHFGPAYPNQQQAGTIATEPDLSTDYHTYTMTKDPNQVTWYVDGSAFYTLFATDKENWGMPNWPFVAGNPFHFLFNVAMGGNFPATPDPNILSASMKVDYVRAYAR